MTCQTSSNLLYNIYTVFVQNLCKILGVQGSDLWITRTKPSGPVLQGPVQGSAVFLNWTILGCPIRPLSSVKVWPLNLNGILNGERLSPEGLENEVYEVKSDGIVARPTSSHLAYFSWTHFQEFRIDINIVGKHSKMMIIHHKVTACIVCIFSDKDIAVHVEQAHMAFLCSIFASLTLGHILERLQQELQKSYKTGTRL